MNPHFSTWYREVNPEPESELLERRWQGIEQLVDKADRPACFELAKLAFRMSDIDAEYQKQFSSTFQEIDKAFRSVNNDVEFAILAASTLVQLLEAESVLGANAAIGLSCLSFCGIRKNEVFPWVTEYAEASLKHQSAKLRDSRDNELPKIPSFKPFGKLDLGEKHAENDWPGALEDVMANINTTVQNLNKASRALASALIRFRETQSLHEEESDILWWLFSGQSHSLETAFCNVEQRTAAIVAGSELAQLTKVSPGPLQLAAFVEAMIAKSPINSPKSQFKTIVGKIDKDWRESCSAEIRPSIKAFFPIHVAIQKSCESQSWSEAFKSIVGVPATTVISPVDLGIQMYRECLLLKSEAAE